VFNPNSTKENFIHQAMTAKEVPLRNLSLFSSSAILSRCCETRSEMPRAACCKQPSLAFLSQRVSPLSWRQKGYGIVSYCGNIIVGLWPQRVDYKMTFSLIVI